MGMRITTIVWKPAEPMFFSKDNGAFQYYLSSELNYISTWAYFEGDKDLNNIEFEKKVKLVNLGKCLTYKEMGNAATLYIEREYSNIDVLCMYGYGGYSYKLANLIKRLNPSSKVWIKLDMSMGGFSHFYDGTKLRKLKNWIEKWKSRNVDLFTVETKYYYDILKNESLFAGERIKYLPNGVCDYGIDVEGIDKIKKENIIVAVGRMGIYEKNYELLLDSLKYINREILKEWKIYFIGPRTREFDVYKDQILEENKYLKEYVSFIDEINDREELYKWLRRAKIYCMTSRSESFGIATIEAMYFGAYPVITNYGKVVHDFIPDDEYGKIINEPNPKKYSNILEQSLLQTYLYDNISKRTRDKFGYVALVKKLNEYIIAAGDRY